MQNIGKRYKIDMEDGPQISEREPKRKQAREKVFDKVAPARDIEKAHYPTSDADQARLRIRSEWLGGRVPGLPDLPLSKNPS